MYSLNEKNEYIKSVQKLLSAVYKNEHIPQNGIYEERTREFILRFQRENELSDNGIIDEKTLKLLYLESKKRNRVYPFSKNLKYRYYDERMRELNEIISELLNYYGKHHRLLPIPYFSEETLLSVNELRKIYSLEDGEEIDEELYGIMIKDYNSLL